MSTMKVSKLLVALITTLFLFSCASSNKSDSEQVATEQTSSDTSSGVIDAPPEKTAEELEQERLAAAMEANRRSREERTVYFNLDDDTVNFEGRALLEAHAWYLSRPENSGIVVTVNGHCDERGTPAYNLALGERRAKAIAQILMLNGVSSSQIKTVSYGEEQPVDPGHDESAWAKNRRGQLDYEG
jgi:peptidoglycan-associated lipoprotein